MYLFLMDSSRSHEFMKLMLDVHLPELGCYFLFVGPGGRREGMMPPSPIARRSPSLPTETIHLSVVDHNALPFSQFACEFSITVVIKLIFLQVWGLQYP
ncbi:hypothetical protein [Pasteuria penetrans]|uniref:hypothetical protein n=1 Tax=Pasteuria penetrans TaxID=86005 RepID=UPI001CAA7AE2|nr:hypothetical protein [Pasteuria penetrans]